MECLNKITMADDNAQKWLKKCKSGQLAFKRYIEFLRYSILAKLMLPEITEETNLYFLSVMSLKARSGSLDPVITDRIKKYDCHQVDNAVKQKVMLIIWLERQLEQKLDHDTVEACDTIEQLALAFWSKLE